MAGRIERRFLTPPTRRWQSMALLIVSAMLATACSGTGSTSPTAPDPTPEPTPAPTPPRPTGPAITAIVSSGCSPRRGALGEPALPVHVYMDGARFGNNENQLGTLMPGQSLKVFVRNGVHIMEAYSNIGMYVKEPEEVVVASNQNTDWHIC